MRNVKPVDSDGPSLTAVCGLLPKLSHVSARLRSKGEPLENVRTISAHRVTQVVQCTIAERAVKVQGTGGSNPDLPPFFPVCIVEVEAFPFSALCAGPVFKEKAVRDHTLHAIHSGQSV